uniref:I/LWEQ domain-containing protein n=1 Tax=Oncorhynchus tshawytscha TaxID=74940 RepID=A0A8C8IVT0_ONCTS
QLHSISKSITSSETPLKEKYARSILSKHEGGATTFWSFIINLPLSSNAIISWKFCYMLHKVLRDGHHNVSHPIHGNLHDRYGHIVSLSAKFLSLKMEFHVKNLLYPCDDIAFSVLGEVHNHPCLLTVWRQLDANAGKSTTPAGQCRLGPLIPVILDCSWLYHFSVKLLFKLHSCVSADSLLGHRERFRDLFNSLTKLFDRARETEFFKKVIQIPDLPDSPPNFLRASALAEYVRPVVVMPNEEPYEEVDAAPQPVYSQAPQVRLDTLPLLYFTLSLTEAEALRKELEVIKPELQLLKTEAQRCVTQLKSQVNRLEAELEDQRTHKQMALVDNEHLRMEVGALRQATAALPGVQAGYQEADGRAQAAELRFSQLKERHAELVTSHADLLKKNAETVRFLSSTQQNQEELATAKQQLASEVEARDSVFPSRKLDSTLLLFSVSFLNQSELFPLPQAGSQMTGALQGLQREREELLRCLREKEGEVSSLQQQAQLHHGSIEQDRDRSAREMASLRQQLQQQGELTRKLQEEQFCLLQCVVVEAEGIILDAVSKLDDPIHVRCTCSPDYLVNRAEITLGSLDKMQQSHMVYLGNMDDASGLLRAVTQFSHLASDTIVNGGATAHSAPTDQADRLTDSCREASTHCLQFLHELKSRATLQRADPTTIRYVMRRILTMGQDLCLQGQDVLKEELGEMVDKEMTATSTAIEEAVLRMDILNQARRDTSGVKLEVNQSILGSCSDLMKAIHMLVTAATDLQKDIVESGRGAASVKEFYAKNSCWTEGLISASKSVGWGATQMLDSADKVVTSGGKYEELIVCSHEIAASTAQLVAASKVKADRNSKKLSTLQQASRHVNDMAAIVVTSTNHGQRQITEREPMDFSGISLIKVKTQEIESQVKVLELENQLEQERVRLGELRKKHYQLSGTGTTHGGEVEVEGGDGDDGGDSFPPPPPPTLLPASTLLPQPYLNTQPFSQTQPDSQLSAHLYIISLM